LATYNRFIHYSRKGLWSLFLIVAFPIHVWTFILYFRDISWITERTNSWNAIGVGAYALLFALFESLVVFLFLFLFGLLLPRKWPEEKRIALLGVLSMLAALVAILGQLYYLMGSEFQEKIYKLLVVTSHPVRVLYLLILIPLTAIVAVLTYFILKSNKVADLVLKFFDRLSLLTSLYLVFDVIGVFIVIFRNIQNSLK
jgi:hypothetical protein